MPLLLRGSGSAPTSYFLLGRVRLVQASYCGAASALRWLLRCTVARVCHARLAPVLLLVVIQIVSDGGRVLLLGVGVVGGVLGDGGLGVAMGFGRRCGVRLVGVVQQALRHTESAMGWLLGRG